MVYKGPFKEVLDDDEHRMERGKRYAVCDKTFELYRDDPYRGQFEHIEPRVEVPLGEAGPFACTGQRLRDPRETKGNDYDLTSDAVACCETDGCC